MHHKIISLICINFLLISCGGDDGSSLENNNLINANNEIEETCIVFGQNTSRCSFIHDGLERFYLIYKPLSLNEEDAPVLIALHGYGSTAVIHKSYTGYEQLAEENKFIVIYPQGYKLESLLVNSSSHWNVGAWTIASEIDDLGFIDSIISLVINKEQVDESRIYSSGMSNGGFMSYHLACNLSRKIAAIASVTGSMSKETLADCAPSHPTAVLQIHGLQDLVVPYSGFDDLGMEPIDDVLAYWANLNSCNPERLVAVVDYFNEKGSIDFINYESCMNSVDVRLIRIPSMGHTWPGLNNFNISASEEIWNFLSQFDLNGKINN
jgi:polyhydroxybutyrate depolymerase